MNTKKYLIKQSSLGYRKRYILYKIYSEKHDINYQEVETAIRSAILDYLGTKLLSRANVWLIRDTYDPKTKTAIMRCNSDYVYDVVASLTLIQYIGDKKIKIEAVDVSGTIKSIYRRKKERVKEYADYDTGNDGI